MTPTVYVAGASKELDRAREVLDWIRASSVLDLAFDWVTEIQLQGGEPNRLPPPAARTASRRALVEVQRASFFWLLVPQVESTGPWVELGHWLRDNPKPRPLASGPDGPIPTIFVETCYRFPSDRVAFEILTKLGRGEDPFRGYSGTMQGASAAALLPED